MGGGARPGFGAYVLKAPLPHPRPKQHTLARQGSKKQTACPPRRESLDGGNTLISADELRQECFDPVDEGRK
jgi:hypothetical protein